MLRKAAILWIFLFTGITAYALISARDNASALCRFVTQDSAVRVAQSKFTSELVANEKGYAVLLDRKAVGKNEAVYSSASRIWFDLATTQEKNYLKSLTIVDAAKKIRDSNC